MNLSRHTSAAIKFISAATAAFSSSGLSPTIQHLLASPAYKDKQLGSYLARNYDVIYLPRFETSQMVARGSRKLNSKSARAMMTWAFYQFSQTLEHLCNRYGSRLVRVTEEYTFKTCTKCGNVHKKLGGAKKFKCPNCGHEIPRDFNGALGIFLKALWDTTMLSEVSDKCAIFGFFPIVGDCLD